MAARPKPWRVPDRFWVEVEPLIPRVERRFRYPGRKRHDDRACLEGILYVLRYAVPWQELPRQEGWPSGQTCWRRFHEWQRAGVWARLLLRMQELLEQEGLADWSRAIVDASLVDAKKGAPRPAAPSGAAPQAAST
jgi:transposase